jgi:hypothetical protein
MDNQTAPTATVTPSVTSSANSWWPFGSTPQPTAIAGQPNVTPINDMTPGVDATPINDITPALEATPISDMTPAPEVTTEAAPVTPEPIIKQISTLINEMIYLTKEIQPWVQNNQLINPQIYEQMIRPRVTRNQEIIDQLHAIANQNATNSTLTDIEKQLVNQIDQFINPCMAIYQEIQTANDNNTIPQDLSNQYGQCNDGSNNLVQYLSGQ